MKSSITSQEFIFFQCAFPLNQYHYFYRQKRQPSEKCPPLTSALLTLVITAACQPAKLLQQFTFLSGNRANSEFLFCAAVYRLPARGPWPWCWLTALTITIGYGDNQEEIFESKQSCCINRSHDSPLWNMGLSFIRKINRQAVHYMYL